MVSDLFNRREKKKICIWYNFPSPHSSYFFSSLSSNREVELQVRYFSDVTKQRLSEGWQKSNSDAAYIKFVDNCSSVEEMLATVENWSTYIHITSYSFCPELVEYFATTNVVWMEWSETSGISLSHLLSYNIYLYNILKRYVFKLSKHRLSYLLKKHALGVFCQGKLSRDYFKLIGIDDSRIKDLYYTVEGIKKCEPDKKIMDFANGRKVFLYVGSLCKRKGIDILIKAFRKCQDKNWCLVLCGTSYKNDKYKNLVRKYGMNDDVLFLGAYPLRYIDGVYNASEVFVLPSRFDGWGAVLNEAASIGLPIISTDMTGAAWHLVDHGISGFRVKAGRVDDLADAMNEYIKTPSLAILHGENTKLIYETDYTPEKNAQRLVRSLDEMMC